MKLIHQLSPEQKKKAKRLFEGVQQMVFYHCVKSGNYDQIHRHKLYSCSASYSQVDR